MPEIIYLNNEEKIHLLQGCLNTCERYGIKLQTCGNGLQFKDLPGIEVTGCFDEHALNLIGIYPKQKNKENNTGCLCYPTTSIGEYNTCLHKCKYCYASEDFEECIEKNNLHDPESPLLIGWPNGNETIIEMKPKLLNTNQLTLNF